MTTRTFFLFGGAGIAAAVITGTILATAQPQQDTFIMEGFCLKNLIQGRKFIEIYGRTYDPSYDGGFSPGEANHQAPYSFYEDSPWMGSIVSKLRPLVISTRSGKATDATPSYVCFYVSEGKTFAEWSDSHGSPRFQVGNDFLVVHEKKETEKSWRREKESKNR